jgi:hypothetical protein
MLIFVLVLAGGLSRRSLGEGGKSCVRQNRVVLAVVATVKHLRRCIDPTGVRCIVNSRGDGDKNEFVTGESAA